MISFKGKHVPKDEILFAVLFYVRYAGSYHDLEEIMQEHGIDVDHATLNRWVVEYGPLLAEEAQKRKQPAASISRLTSAMPAGIAFDPNGSNEAVNEGRPKSAQSRVNGFEPINVQGSGSISSAPP